MNDYHAVMHASANEDGNEELKIDYDRTFWQWLTRKPATTTTYVKSAAGWVNKATGWFLHHDEEMTVLRAEYSIKARSTLMS